MLCEHHSEMTLLERKYLHKQKEENVQLELFLLAS